MDWKRAIEINREALRRIVATLVALLASQRGAARLPLPVYRLIARVLYPAESAVRRLIVIAARGLVVPVPAARPMPAGLVIAGMGSGPMVFRLFDTRKHFSDADDAATVTGPRIRSVSDQDPRSQFLARFAVAAEKDPGTHCSESETWHISRRLDAVKRALDNLSREARRMVRWRVRRLRMQRPVFTTPLRPGPPPGHRKRGRDEIDRVLRECHGLACDVLAENTS